VPGDILHALRIRSARIRQRNRLLVQPWRNYPFHRHESNWLPRRLSRTISVQGNHPRINPGQYQYRVNFYVNDFYSV